jgi:hypothetical protein
VFDDLGFGPIGVARFSGSGQVRGEPIKKRIEAKATILLPDFELRSTEKYFIRQSFFKISEKN